MSTSRKHYREAAAIRNNTLRCHPAAEDVINEIAGDLAAMFKRDNSSFNRWRFMDAVHDGIPAQDNA